MNGSKRRKMSLIIVVVALFLLINIGYAFLSKQLTINGVTKVDSMALDVQFTDKHAYTSNTTGTCTAEISESGTQFDFNADLKMVGEYCTYTVLVKNFGSIPATFSFDSNISGWDGKTTPYIEEDGNTFFGLKADDEPADSDKCNSSYCDEDYDGIYTCPDGYKYKYMDHHCYRIYDSFDDINLVKGDSVKLRIVYNVKANATLPGDGSSSTAFTKNFSFKLVSKQGSATASSIMDSRDRSAREKFRGSWRG